MGQMKQLFIGHVETCPYCQETDEPSEQAECFKKELGDIVDSLREEAKAAAAFEGGQK